MLCIAHFYDPQMVLSAHTPRRLRLPQSPASCLLLSHRLLPPPPLHADSQMGFGEYRPNSRREEESKREREKDGVASFALMCQTEVEIGIGLWFLDCIVRWQVEANWRQPPAGQQDSCWSRQRNPRQGYRVSQRSAELPGFGLMRIYLTQLHYEHFGLMLISGGDESEIRRKWGQCGVKLAKVVEGGGGA